MLLKIKIIYKYVLRLVVGLFFVTLFAAKISAQESEPNKDFWMTPNSTAEDFGQFLDVNNVPKWQNVYDKVKVFKFYFVNIAPQHPSYMGDQNFEKFKTFLRKIKSDGKKVAFEVAGVYAQVCDTEKRPNILPQVFEPAVQIEGGILSSVTSMGLNIDYLVLDGPFYRIFESTSSSCISKFGKKINLQYAAQQVVYYMKIMRNKFPGVKFVLLSNFPNWNFREFNSVNGVGERIRDSQGNAINYEQVLRTAVELARGYGIPFDGFQIDNPYNFIYYNSGLIESGRSYGQGLEDKWSRLSQLVDLAHSLNLKVSLILNSETPGYPQGKNRDFFFRNQNSQIFSNLTIQYAADLRFLKNIPVEQYVVQSWYDAPTYIFPVLTRYTFSNVVSNVMFLLSPQVIVSSSTPARSPASRAKPTVSQSLKKK
ncbi:MAG: hypothetical protein K1X29_07075 [Bdellovibrionales bacterium]|nr:hypothetical protein [Bdellovibrionales bacterium]